MEQGKWSICSFWSWSYFILTFCLEYTIVWSLPAAFTRDGAVRGIQELIVVKVMFCVKYKKIVRGTSILMLKGISWNLSWLHAGSEEMLWDKLKEATKKVDFDMSDGRPFMKGLAFLKFDFFVKYWNSMQHNFWEVSDQVEIEWLNVKYKRLMWREIVKRSF